MDGRKCDLCPEATCRCIDKCLPLLSTSGAYAGKGSGVHAAAAYLKDTILAQIVGRIVPPDIYGDDEALEFRRADLPGKPIAGQIYCRNEGNLFRRINRACGDHASAAMMGIRISGKYRIVCYATRALDEGEEITIEWGVCGGCNKAGVPRG